MSKIIEFTESEFFLLKNAVANLQSDLVSRRDSSAADSDRLYFMHCIKELDSLRFKLRGL